MLYSHSVRYFAEFPDTSQRWLFEELFGVPGQLSPHMPKNLRNFAERTEIMTGLDKEAVFWSHTMYPFTCAYLSKEAQAETTSYAHFGASGRRRAGMPTTIAPPKFLRWCPRCVLEDRSRADCGEAYWRRAHQLPGVWQCDQHLEDLVDSDVPRFSSGLIQLAAELVVPKDVEEHRQERSASPAETKLRRRMLALLNSAEFSPGMLKPDYKTAAVRAGFEAQGGLVDYQKLYEAFADFWGDVLPRADELHRARGMGVSWLHGQFNAKNPIIQPVTRELIEIFFSELGVSVGEQQLKAKSERRVFYCPSPYADHGPGTEVNKVRRVRRHPDRVSLTCDCGLAVVVPPEVSNRQFGMDDVITVTRYGAAWYREFEKLRGEGVEWNDAARQLGISTAQVSYWRRAFKPKVEMLPDEARDASRSEWLCILSEIAPRRPTVATQSYRRQYARLRDHDREWLEKTMNAYREQHNCPLYRRTDWKARDEEYPERLVAAASRLLSLQRVQALTVHCLLKESGISDYSIRRYAEKLPRTIDTLARLTRGDLTPTLSAVLTA